MEVVLDICIVCLQKCCEGTYICAVSNICSESELLHGSRCCSVRLSYLVHGLRVGQKCDGRVVFNFVISRRDLHVFRQTEEQIMAGHREPVEREQKMKECS